MCLVLLALDAHPDYPLIVAANRDERHGRPAQALHWWSEQPGIAGGRDLEAGGTWMAVRSDARFAALLNDPRFDAPPDAPSRGELVPAFLAAEDAAGTVARVHAHVGDYAGFHFLGGGPSEVWVAGRSADEPTALSAGVHGLDNHGLDSGGARLERALAGFRGSLERRVGVAALFRMLGDDEQPGPGPGDARPVFITGETYGTRGSTVLLVDSDGVVQLTERRFDASGACQEERRLEWASALATG
ncbi:MAG: NRDE family protein [Halofilum sp. (in: g-proteobacteria)]